MAAPALCSCILQGDHICLCLCPRCCHANTVRTRAVVLIEMARVPCLLRCSCLVCQVNAHYVPDRDLREILIDLRRINRENAQFEAANANAAANAGDNDAESVSDDELDLLE